MMEASGRCLWRRRASWEGREEEVCGCSGGNYFVRKSVGDTGIEMTGWRRRRCDGEGRRRRRRREGGREGR